MEESINSFIKNSFDITGCDIKTYSPLALAYIGDCVFDLYIRSIIINQGNMQANKLHNKASKIVCAFNQASMIDKMLPHMTEEEISVYNRGRNAKQKTFAKNSSMHDYKKATGFEALIGYLYLSDQDERIVELIKIGL